ncbi:DNA/RNA non-specific endonuclease [Tellurirhabdus bombi]|uniref:DNA/RNA non-specific endonuclease n=1 Tax=Tellurirhabdus bombi TaxID=2907205 RepID=UPI001F2E4674|nr:DNA/RNA non-specific endonuclease [Tellurirhabdus bombi]
MKNAHRTFVLTLLVISFFGACKRTQVDPTGIPDTPDSLLPSRDDVLALGNPTNASTDPSSERNYLMKKSSLVLSYNKSTGTPNWVAWHLSKAWKGHHLLNGTLAADPALPSGWPSVLPTDYTNNGFERLMLCPPSDRDSLAADLAPTYLMTNVLPAAPAVVRGPWAGFENYCRKLLNDGYELYIYAGGSGQGGTGDQGTAQSIAKGKIAVPQALWKVVLVLPVGTQDLKRVSAAARTIAVWIPNNNASGNTSWTNFRTSVDQIESRTSTDFFSAVPVDIQRIIEASADVITVN